MLSNAKQSKSAVLGPTGYDGMNAIHPVDMDEMHLDTEEQKCSLINMSLKKQSFKSTYKSPRARNAKNTQYGEQTCW